MDEFGVFLEPAAGAHRTAVLVLGGSEGGVPVALARRFVDEGFAPLAFVYHNHPGLPDVLSEIPLERVLDALRLLVRRDDVVTPDGRVAVAGYSKGGELALLVASLLPELVGPVVAYTPSSVVWQGLAFTGPPRSSWTLDGRPLPFVPYPFVGPSVTERGMSILPIYDGGLDDAEGVSAAAIEIENSTGPILLVSGGDDRMWPATRMCRMIVARMKAHGRTDCNHLDFPEAGHVLMPFDRSRVPADAPRMDLGGYPGANERAHEEAWPTVVAHLLARD